MLRELVTSAIVLTGFIQISSAEPFPRSYTGLTIRSASTHDIAPVELTFSADGRVSGSFGCNRVMGAWSRQSDRVSVTNLATTKMACAPERMALERTVLAALSTSGRLTDDALTFGDGRDVVVQFK
jgi:heat shock protein HslJ